MLKRISQAAVVSFLTVSSSVQAQEVRRFGGESPRMNTRIAYFGLNSSEGQLAVDYGQPEWRPEYDTEFDELTKGKRWRFGNDFWTTLDTHLDLVIADTEIESGYYYLVLQRSKSDEWHLILLDPREIHAKKLDASMADQTTGGIEVPLTWEQVDDSVQKLQITLTPNKDDLKKATIEVRWGKHRLSAPIEIRL